MWCYHAKNQLIAFDVLPRAHFAVVVFPNAQRRPGRTELAAVRTPHLVMAVAARLVAGREASRVVAKAEVEVKVRVTAAKATVEEEAELDQALEDMFEQDASRLFWLNRIPRALTSG